MPQSQAACCHLLDRVSLRVPSAEGLAELVTSGVRSAVAEIAGGGGGFRFHPTLRGPERRGGSGSAQMARDQKGGVQGHPSHPNEHYFGVDCPPLICGGTSLESLTLTPNQFFARRSSESIRMLVQTTAKMLGAQKETMLS